MTSSLAGITLLADRPDLATEWAELHWREWGSGSIEPGRKELSWWVDDASKAIGRTHVPAAFIALGHTGEVLGGVGLHQYALDERRDRSPWIVGTIVRANRRGEGIGQALMAYLEAWAVDAGIGQVWVWTETDGGAVAFYQRCGYDRVEDPSSRTGEAVTILTKKLSPAHR